MLAPVCLLGEKLGSMGYRELVDFGEVIGFHFSKKPPHIRTKTSFGQIHYAKDGVHIVPAHPNEWTECIQYLKGIYEKR